MAGPLRSLLLGVVREGSRSRCPSLFVHVWLHLVWVRLLLGVGKRLVRLWQAVGMVWLHIVGILGVVHGRLWHVCVAVHSARLRARWPNRLAHVRPHSADVVS
jgi:hypothetical protein